MLSSFRNRFGIPGVISVIALVFAMIGGAYAASDNGSSGSEATASAKAKKGPKGPKGPKGAKGDTGPMGPAGPAGPQGPAGPKGDTGDRGDNGTSGANGLSVTNSEVPAGEFECEERGGAEFKVGGGAPTFACNGEEGSPWTAGGTLPSGETQTGTWGNELSSQEEEEGLHVGVGLAPISFPIPLAAELDGAHVKYVNMTDTVPAECEDSTHTGPASAVNPEAQPGYLCVYVADATEDHPDLVNGVWKVDRFIQVSGASTSGAVASLVLESANPYNLVMGTFAVTAP